MKSDTCFSKFGIPLSVFMTEAEAQNVANCWAGLSPYKCKKCGLWHIDPQIICVESLKNACSCKDSHGNSKNLYTTRTAAEKAQRISAAMYDVSPSICECPKGKGWHLTDN